MNLINDTSWHEFQLIVWLDVYNESVCDLVMCKENVVFIRFLHAINACPLINWDAHREQVTLFWSAAKQKWIDRHILRLLICSAALPPPHLLSKKMRAIPFVTLTALTLLHHWKFIQYSVSAAWGNSCHFPAHTSTGKRSMHKALRSTSCYHPDCPLKVQNTAPCCHSPLSHAFTQRSAKQPLVFHRANPWHAFSSRHQQQEFYPPISSSITVRSGFMRAVNL